VAGIVPGTDPKLREEAVIYSAHWDHLGIDEGTRQNGKPDHIWNGAIDNGSGTAALLAMAQAAVRIRRAAPRSSCGPAPRSRACWAAWPTPARPCGRWRRRPPT
jgi:hypothetical protein